MHLSNKNVSCATLVFLALFGLNTVSAEEVDTNTSNFTLDTGLRYWYSTGDTSYNLYADKTRGEKVSALQYKSQITNAGELFFRLDHKTGFFLKGFAGVGRVVDGKEYDEDFEPATTPYSRTLAKVDGDIEYASMDVGYTFIDTREHNLPLSYRVGGFVGYNFWSEKFEARGCQQLATNLNCSPGDVGPNELGITEKDWFNGVRVGVVGDMFFKDKWKATVEAAYLRTKHRNTDIHHLSGLGLTPGRGDGDGYQLEGSINYLFTPQISIGAGWRYWRINSDIHTEITAVALSNQLETYKVEREGAFLQAVYTFQ